MQDMSANRIRKPTNITLDPALIERLDAWIAKQPFRLARSGVVEEAIKGFLDAQEDCHHGGRHSRIRGSACGACLQRNDARSGTHADGNADMVIDLKLAEELLREGLSATDVARECGVSRQTVYNHFSPQRRQRLAKLGPKKSKK